MKKENKTALITGSGAKRIGNFIAFELAKKRYNIAIHYNTSREEAEKTVEELKKLNIRAEAYKADLIDEQQVKKLAERVKNDFGSIDVLVNTAAAFKKIPLEKTTANDVLFFFKTNTLSQFLCSKYVGEIMIEQKEGGNIIHIADWAIIRPYADYAAYFASKGSIPTITKVFANELGKRNNKIRVNCISPGPVLLPENMPEEEKQKAINKTLLKREGSPKNIALAVLHFIENDFITGQNLNVDGGKSIYNDE